MRIRNKGKNKEVFDQVRKKFIHLSPEELVRQHIINYLSKEKKYPISLFSVEKQTNCNLAGRYDIVIYNNDGTAFMLVECKAKDIPINQDVFDQTSKYNKTIKAKYILITNGEIHYCCKMNYENHSYEFLNDIPNYYIE